MVLALASAVVAEPAAARPGEVWILAFQALGSGSQFERQVAALDREGYRAVTIGRVWQAWRGEASLPRRPVVLSFDDGYRSHYRAALPALRARSWPGVLNLQVDRLGVAGGLTRAQVREMLAAGWELDSASSTGPDLTAVGRPRLRRELVDSRKAIERVFGVTPNFFCFPGGRVDDRAKAAVRAAGYLAATTTRPGVAAPGGDRYALPRIGVDGGMSPSALLRALRRA